MISLEIESEQRCIAGPLLLNLRPSISEVSEYIKAGVGVLRTFHGIILIKILSLKEFVNTAVQLLFS